MTFWVRVNLLILIGQVHEESSLLFLIEIYYNLKENGSRNQ